MALKMRQSLDRFEEEFRQEAQADRQRAAHLRRHAVMRGRIRRVEKAKKHGTVRFWVLVASLIATAVIVTVAMFETLYYLLG